jgi:hypothetical protein
MTTQKKKDIFMGKLPPRYMAVILAYVILKFDFTQLNWDSDSIFH